MSTNTLYWTDIPVTNLEGTAGTPKYLEDKRTCTLPVKLQPDKTYAIWINSEKFYDFKDAKGQPAVPYLLVCKTPE